MKIIMYSIDICNKLLKNNKSNKHLLTTTLLPNQSNCFHRKTKSHIYRSRENVLWSGYGNVFLPCAKSSTRHDDLSLKKLMRMNRILKAFVDRDHILLFTITLFKNWYITYWFDLLSLILISGVKHQYLYPAGIYFHV